MSFRYKIIIEYDGTKFFGWQKQSDSNTIQSHIENAIEKFSKEKVFLYAAGRTDSGVHARGQIAHFDLSNCWEEHVILRALNHFVRPYIAILKCEHVTAEFHARFSATYRSYQYFILNRTSYSPILQNRSWHVRENLSIELMQKAADLMLGTHDFTSFRTVICQSKSPIKTIDFLKIEKINDDVIVSIQAKSFLHHMVRNIVGTLKLIGCRKWSPEIITDIINAKDRSKAGPTAPPYGLYLTKVGY